jgi:hypothetical protein
VQLDRVPPARSAQEQESGTATPPGGVGTGACSSSDSTFPRPPLTPAGVLSCALVLVLCVGLLGQGQRYSVDPRFCSPVATLRTYWESLRQGDAETASLCIEEGSYTGPFPGAVWFMPPSRNLRLTEVHELPVRHGRVLVNYEVHYLALGVSEELSFRSESQLTEHQGEWRITPPFGEVNVQEWRPIRRLAPI